MLVRLIRAVSLSPSLTSSRSNLRLFQKRMESSVARHQTDEILVEKKGPLIISTLNRPSALNALNTSMIIQLTNYFREWDVDSSDVGAVVMKGAGGKAFCAGGDVKGIVLCESKEQRIDFFHREYRMNYLIAKLQKPLICLMDGIVMGGGCGIAMHAPFRIATERTVCAMPECVIGFVPDVGASYFLNRLPDGIGSYMALSGKRIKGLELKAVGLATHYIASDQMPVVMQKLEEMGKSVRDHSAVDATLKKLEVLDHLKTMPSLHEPLARMGNIFNPFESSVEEILAKLETAGDEDSREALQNIHSGSPLSAALAHELLKRVAGHSLRTCLETETILATSLSREEGDFVEGVRALLIDKDKNPKWKYQRSQITTELIDGFFHKKEGDPTLLGPSAKL